VGVPVVAIIGRPNVGKSSLLNALAGKRISIVEPTAGVTRDRISVIIEQDDRYLELVDTGGFGVEDVDRLTAHIEEQIRLAVAQADVVIFLCDVRAGVTTLDRQVAQMVRRIDRPVQLAVNKVDVHGLVPQAAEFSELGFGHPHCISATHGRGLSQLMERIVELLGEREAEGAPEPSIMKLATVGKRNVGKSTLINTLAGGPRVIVSEIPGTTRDAVDVTFERDGKKFTAIDTAGVRKRSKLRDDIEFYSLHRAGLSIRRADVVLHLIDATMDVGILDKQLVRNVVDQYKPLVLVVSKWDLAKGKAEVGEYESYLKQVLPGVSFSPISFISALDRENVWETIDLAEELFEQSGKRITTGKLNSAVEEVIQYQRPPTDKRGRRLKIYYASQVAVHPPGIVLSVNDPELMTRDYLRYFTNRLREYLPFPEIPFRIILRHHRRKASSKAT
jgi:GTP-binding protein